VKTCASEETLESFSLLPSSDSRRQNFGSQIEEIEKNFLRANRTREFSHSLGQEERFTPPRLSGRYRSESSLLLSRIDDRDF
jgi:hypothetical protein